MADTTALNNLKAYIAKVHASQSKETVVLQPAPATKKLSAKELGLDSTQKSAGKGKSAQNDAGQAGDSAEKAGKASPDFSALADKGILKKPPPLGEGKVATFFKDLGSGIKRGVERLPDVGDATYPLIILLIFWLVIFKVNGHTRFEWFFLVLTGGAHIQAQLGQVDSSGEGSAPNTNTTSTNPASTNQNVAAPIILPGLGLPTAGAGGDR